MARYVVLLDWTDQGVRSAIKETVQRVAQAPTVWWRRAAQPRPDAFPTAPLRPRAPDA